MCFWLGHTEQACFWLSHTEQARCSESAARGGHPVRRQACCRAAAVGPPGSEAGGSCGDSDLLAALPPESRAARAVRFIDSVGAVKTLGPA